MASADHAGPPDHAGEAGPLSSTESRGSARALARTPSRAGKHCHVQPTLRSIGKIFAARYFAGRVHNPQKAGIRAAPRDRQLGPAPSARKVRCRFGRLRRNRSGAIVSGQGVGGSPVQARPRRHMHAGIRLGMACPERRGGPSIDGRCTKAPACRRKHAGSPAGMRRCMHGPATDVVTRGGAVR